MEELNLSNQQKSIIRAALTLTSLAVIGYIILFLFNKLSDFLGMFSGVLLPIAVAAIAALVLKPYHNWLLKKTKGKNMLSVVIIFLSILLPLFGFLFFFGHVLIGQIAEIIDEIPQLVTRMTEQVQSRWPEISAFISENEEEIIETLKKVSMSVWQVGKTTYGAVTGMLGWVVLPIYLFFFLMAPSLKLEKLEDVLPFLKESTRKDVLFLVNQFVDILVSFFRGQLVIALIQGIMFGVGFSLAGLRFGFVLGLLLGVLNIVPYLGNIIGLSVCIPLAFFQTGGGLPLVGIIVLIFAAVQVIEGYFLTPKIMGDRTGLHPLVIMISIFFWGTALSGIVGMLLAVPLTAFLVVFWRLAKEKYIHEWI